jgi:hypothetical protein
VCLENSNFYSVAAIFLNNSGDKEIINLLNYPWIKESFNSTIANKYRINIINRGIKTEASDKLISPKDRCI